MLLPWASCSLCVREEGSRESGPPLQHHWIELNAIITKNPPKKTKHHVMCQRAKRQSKWPKSTKIAAHCQFVTLYSWFKNHCNSSQTFTQLLVLKGLLPPKASCNLTEVLAWGVLSPTLLGEAYKSMSPSVEVLLQGLKV
jgi:hypothetical protein